jgi:hypothetical protein
MRRLNLDLVKPPLPAWPGMLVLAVALVCAWMSYRQYVGAIERNEKIESELAQADAASRKLRAALRPVPLSRDEIETATRRAREVASLLLLPWRDLFLAVESASHNDVALLAIEPDPGKRVIRITAEGRNFDSIAVYLKRLGATTQLKFVRLLRYETGADGKPHPLRFTVEASWKLSS